MSPQEPRKQDQQGNTPETGAERQEPGEPTREVPNDAQGEIAEVAKQQGASQRGYTGDNQSQYDESVGAGSKVTGDPGRGSPV
jgi:hypothetical protein